MNKIDDFYLNRWSMNKDWTKIGTSKKKRLDNLMSLLFKFTPNNNIKIIDFGCGSGWILYFLNELDFKRLYAYDVTPSTLKLLVEKYPFLTKIFGLQNETSKDITKGYFDLCITSEVYEHIPYDEKEKFLLEINSILQENGFLYLTTPNGRFKSKALTESNEQPIEDWDSPKRVANLLNQTGFEILEKGSFYLSPKFSIIHRLMLGSKASQIFKRIGLKNKLEEQFEKRMLGLSTYFFCKKVS